jgi:2-oxo-4-hydroxy-4-carboxy-5-ureidoimidazoline decarboxylase
MSQASVEEQASAGLDRLTADEYTEVRRLNAEYRDKFGFPFLYAVKGSTRHDILKALAQRVEGAPEAEFRVALEQVYRIARFRLEEKPINLCSTSQAETNGIITERAT